MKTPIFALLLLACSPIACGPPRSGGRTNTSPTLRQPEPERSTIQTTAATASPCRDAPVDGMFAAVLGWRDGTAAVSTQYQTVVRHADGSLETAPIACTQLLGSTSRNIWCVDAFLSVETPRFQVSFTHDSGHTWHVSRELRETMAGDVAGLLSVIPGAAIAPNLDTLLVASTQGDVWQYEATSSDEFIATRLVKPRSSIATNTVLLSEHKACWVADRDTQCAAFGAGQVQWSNPRTEPLRATASSAQGAWWAVTGAGALVYSPEHDPQRWTEVQAVASYVLGGLASTTDGAFVHAGKNEHLFFLDVGNDASLRHVAPAPPTVVFSASGGPLITASADGAFLLQDSALVQVLPGCTGKSR